MKTNSAGFVDYQWSKPGMTEAGTQALPKGYQRWGWIVGTGSTSTT